MDTFEDPSRTRLLMDEEESYSRDFHRRLVESASPIPQYTPRRPLIEQCTNEWQQHTQWKSRRNSSPDGFDDALESFFDRCLAILKAPKIRRYLLLYTVILIFSIWLWSSMIWPVWAEQRMLARSLSAENRRASGGLFGSNLRPTFPNMIQVKDLDTKFVPKATASKDARADNVNRLIFVGDVHGCLDELKALLAKVNFNTKTDHLIAVGDVIAKGPDSGGTVDFLRETGASCVRGNHEDRILLMAHDANSSPLKVETPASQSSSDSSPARTLAASLTASQIAYLESCPLILRVGFLKPLASDLVVVHAGLVPGIPLDRQDPTSVMNMRSIHLNTHVPSKEPNPEGSVHWVKLWNKYQQSLPAQWSFFPSGIFGAQSAKEKRTTVIYGHDAPRGLQLKQYSKGIDTGCVKGGKLTALVLSANGSWQTVQVQCKDYRKRRPLDVEVEDVLRDGKLSKPDDEQEE
ncbi:hypothetical protein EPUS_08253 [Endocarpon pusillum Z07020]|uniref:Calcineurin-like phosphoesterase domain-containing protein n=1 Tax=Endocarpon pusillum (strain Z07020 / HMAS-L-300199) TaxID=1263415 RepID=U1I219_ENDPU|nr:uncharacterized protein EPUS_08253 [Endocarpon pusillum Z07020]ERF75999.1 hypothetical protein EPUS_08253 [Endocarpon pusillum Z07020]